MFVFVRVNIDSIMACLFIVSDCDRFEAGTPAIGEAIGLGTAIDYLSAIGMQKIHEYEVKICTIFLATLPKNTSILHASGSY